MRFCGLLLAVLFVGLPSWAQEAPPTPPGEGAQGPDAPVLPPDGAQPENLGAPGLAPPEGVAGPAPGGDRLPVLKVGANFLVSVTARADQVGGETLLLRLVSTSEGTHEVTVF
ncbi:MAG: hypothetical protein VX519_11105, partial [Myxococcota bacterium]|nr:hypothetical protein [Myxococcota bacterium]